MGAQERLRELVRKRRAPSEAAAPAGATADDGARDRAEVFGMPAQRRRFRNTRFFVPDYAAHVPVAKHILDRQLVSPRLHALVRDVLAHDQGSMVHAGTFFGDMLTSFSRKTPGTVYAFEAVLENYLFARRTLAANDLHNVLLFHAALGPDNANVEVETEHHQSGQHRGGSAFVHQAEKGRRKLNTQRVAQLTVDQFSITDLSLIQLDVEGYEPHVLRGAERSVAGNRPVIVVEDHHDECAGLLGSWQYVEVRRLGLDRVYIPEERADTLLPVVQGELPVGSA